MNHHHLHLLILFRSIPPYTPSQDIHPTRTHKTPNLKTRPNIFPYPMRTPTPTTHRTTPTRIYRNSRVFTSTTIRWASSRR